MQPFHIPLGLPYPSIRSRFMLTAGMILAVILLSAQTVAAQRTPSEVQQSSVMTKQLVDSRKGYVLRIPEEAVLDSSQSGWSPTGLYEQRVYKIPGAGEIRCTVSVTEQTIPDSAVTSDPYIYTLTDSSTSGGTAYSKTYYMPTRSVRIELVPHSIGMHPYINAREQIFNSFRWKPGANTTAVDVNAGEGMPLPENIPEQSTSIFGGD